MNIIAEMGKRYSQLDEHYSGDGVKTPHNLMKIIAEMGKRHSQLDEDYSGDGEGTLTT